MPDLIADHEGKVFNIYLMDEIPKFKSGWRRIKVLKVGREWVRLESGGRTVKIPLKVWANLIVRQIQPQR